MSHSHIYKGHFEPIAVLIVRLVAAATAIFLVLAWFNIGNNSVIGQQSPTVIPKTAHKENPSFSNASGSIASLQNDQSGRPEWILSGRWSMKTISVQSPPPAPSANGQTNKSTTSLVALDSSFGMVKLDGSGKHSHKISNFKLIGSPISNNKTITFNGTGTISMKDGPHNDVPISIKIIDKGAIIISMDPAKVNNHFGNTPIYGNVVKRH